MAEYIYEIIKDSDGVDCYIKRGEIVRCRDCEFYTAEDRWCRRLGLCGAFGEDDFCCHGEKRRE